jgi:Mg/Co/Ni transporter MgtE
VTEPTREFRVGFIVGLVLGVGGVLLLLWGLL